MARRLRPLDWLLLVVLTGTWATAFVRALQDGVQTGLARVRVSLRSPTAPAAYPVVRAVPTQGWNVDLAEGDEILAVDGRDLAGRTPLFFFEEANRVGRAQGAAPLRVRHGGTIVERRAEVVPTPGWWLYLGASATVMVVAVLLFVRAPGWHVARRYFAGTVCFCTTIVLVPSMVPPRTVADGLLAWALFPLGAFLLLLVSQEFTRSARPVPWSQRALAGLTLVAFVALFATLSAVPLPDLLDVALTALALPLFVVGIVAGLVRTYRRSEPLEKRQVRWMFLGGMIAALAGVFDSIAFAVGAPLALIAFLTSVMLVATPLGILVSVIGSGWLDVDRLISATLSYATVGLVIVGAALAMIPAVAHAAARHVGLDPSMSQWALTMGCVVAAMPAHRFLYPRLDRRLFAAHHERMVGFEELLDDIGRFATVEDLTRRPAERMEALLGPESIAIYGREAQAFLPLYVRGRAAPPAFAADSPLVRTLEQRARPLTIDAAHVDPFDRAALETLGVSVVVPTRRRETLLAFTCLGRKRSGDIYTPEELAYLTAVANRCSEILMRLDGEVVVHEAREMQRALRRYVPGAVVDELDAGRELVPSEQEISILFVDIRGYTTFSESRASDEIFSTLNIYTEKVSRLVREHGGSIVEFNGDGMMAVFGAPRALDGKERAAVAAARDVVDALAGTLAVGVGIATGRTFVGNIRAADRLIWTAVGNTTNLASRLQSLTRDLGALIAIDAPTHARAGYVCADFERHAEVSIRGRSDRCEVWTLPIAGAPPRGVVNG